MKSYLRFLFALFSAMFFLVGLQSGAALAAATFSTIPLDVSHWNVMLRGAWSLTADGLQMNGSGSRVYNRLYSEDIFDFASSEVLIKWKANGAGTYMTANPGIHIFLSGQSPGGYGQSLTTGWSYGGSTAISDNTWLYSRFVFPSNTTGSVTVTVATGNYDNAGGSVLRTDTLPATSGLSGLIEAQLGDNYGSTSAYLVLGEVKTTARVISATPQVTYNFNDGILPAGLGLPATSAISNQTLLVNPDSSSQTVTINVANKNRISFAFSTDDNTNANNAGGDSHLPIIKFDGYGQINFGSSGGTQWRRLSLPIPAGTQNVQIVSYQGYRLWLDDLTLYGDVIPTYTLTETKSGTGTGSITANTGTISWNSNTGTASYNSGTSVTLTATPDSGSTFTGWSGACTGTGTCTVTKDAAKEVTATFTIKPAPTLTGISLINCPSTLNAGASGSCTVTANYSDGSSKAVSPTWSSSNPTVLFVDSSGKLTAGAPSSDTPVTITASFTEGGITKTATVPVTVKADIAKLTGLKISGDTGVKSGFSIALTAKASYSDGASHEVSATWVSSDSTIATVSGAGLVTAKTVTTDTPVTITASYTENGVTQTATWMVSVKAVPVVLTDLILSGADSLEAGKTATYTAKAVYSDGNSKPAGNIIWSSSGMGATIDAQGVLTADAKLSADAVVTIMAIYTENGTTKTAQMKVKINIKPDVETSACDGSGANLSAITVAGPSVKKPGDSLEVNYCLKNYNSATWFDVYVAVQLPDGTLLFMKSAGFFDTPTFTAEVVPYLANTLIPDKSGKVLQMSALSMGLPTGTYTFYAIPVLAGKNVMTGFNWVGELASGKINLNR